MSSPLITLLTDFGTSDSYVAEVKAVLLSWHPGARIVDITHQVSPFDIEEAAFQLLRSHSWFPKNTYHLTIVDPGVGTSRESVYVRTRDYHFIGPDNGVLLWAVKATEKREGRAATIYRIPVPAGTRPTFHGRDVFAPFAARHLSNPDVPLERIAELTGREFPKHFEAAGNLIGQIISCDHFGNLITCIPYGDESSATAEVGAYAERLVSAPNYLAIPRGKAALVKGSHGFWEIACATGSAAALLLVKKGDRVILTRGA
jgi:S-adenosylmethionine hydrolase